MGLQLSLTVLAACTRWPRTVLLRGILHNVSNDEEELLHAKRTFTVSFTILRFTILKKFRKISIAPVLVCNGTLKKEDGMLYRKMQPGFDVKQIAICGCT
jgi:hypothetical protein